MTAQNAAQFNPVRRSAMHHKHLELGASMVERNGWQQPAHFGSVEADAKHLREAVGLFDISPRVKFALMGDQLDQLVSRVFSTVSVPDVGEICLGAPADGNHDAKTVLCRLAGDEILCVAPAGSAPRLAEVL